MLKIGEFARISGITTATLRYYDSCGLLKPVSTDQENSYRYYTLEQLPRLNRILTFKDLGFSLEQITQLLNEDIPLDQLRGMFKLKQAETQQLIAAEQARLSRIEVRLRQIEQEKIMSTYNTVLKQVEPLLVASLREIVPSVNDVPHLFDVLHTHMNKYNIQGASSNLVLWHEEGGQKEGVDAEVAEPLTTYIPETEQVKVRTLPGATIASTIHHGGYDTIGQAYAALYQWIEDNEYAITEPTRQVHLHYAYNMDPGLYVTELQFPVKKK